MAIKTTQIDGDVSIGRNVALGGGAYVEGNSIFKSDVRIDGWLIAKNIQGPNKGLFTTLAALEAAFPTPEPGWWAVVGTETPWTVYHVENGRWVPGGAQIGGDPDGSGDDSRPMFDTTELNGRVDNIDNTIIGINTDLDHINGIIKGHSDDIDGLKHNADALTGRVDKAETDIIGFTKKHGDLESRVGTIEDETMPELVEKITLLTGSKGQPGGWVPLDDKGKIDKKYLPVTTSGTTTPERKTIPFYDVVATDRVMDWTTRNSTDGDYKICYNATTDKFMLAMPFRTGDFDIANCECAYVWGDNDKYETLDDTAIYQSAQGNLYHVVDGRLTLMTDSTPEGGEGRDGAEIDEIRDTVELHIAEMKPRVEKVEADIAGMKPRVEMMEARVEKAGIPYGLINANELLGRRGVTMTFPEVLAQIDSLETKEDVEFPGVILTFLTNTGWATKQWVNSTAWGNEACWEDLCLSVNATKAVIEAAVKARFANILGVLGGVDGGSTSTEDKGCDCRPVTECTKDDIDDILGNRD